MHVRALVVSVACVLCSECPSPCAVIDHFHGRVDVLNMELRKKYNADLEGEYPPSSDSPTDVSACSAP
jgi:hypothetical protein